MEFPQKYYPFAFRAIPAVPFRGYSDLFVEFTATPPQPYVSTYGFRRGWGKLIQKSLKSPRKNHSGNGSFILALRGE